MRKPGGESGFALLFVYAMAATVAIMLYMELPRVAFEAQRDKEQLLIDRGEQYSRAIGLFVRKFNRYPADFDALLNTQNLKFLRHKYKDPMTGKDEWRVVHVGPGGVFTDSLVYGKKKDDKQAAEAQNFITEMQQTGGNQTTGNQQGVNIATRQRPSDQPGGGGDPNSPGAGSFPQPGTPQFGVPQQPPGIPQFDANGQPVPNAPGQGNALLPGQFQQDPNAPGGQVPPGGLPPGGQYPQGGIPGQQGGLSSAAANLIGQLLTTPRPGGLNGLGVPQPTPGGGLAGGGLTGGGVGTPNTGTAPAPVAGQTIGGGIAGVASKLEQDGIKLYGDRTPYNEWEFVYDITKDPTRGGGAQTQTQTGNQAGTNTPPPAPTQPPTVTPH